MDNYLLLKLIHILAAVVVAGTGTGIAFFMLMASRSNNVQAMAVTAKHVVLADWLFTAPAVVVQFISGVLLMQKLGYGFYSTWFLTVFSLFVFIGLCWLPVVKIQYDLKTEAQQALETGEVSARFTQLMRLWTALGIPAFVGMLAIFYLMVFKPLAVV
ncbi:MAG: DUF2269 domain-containing protein [Pseudomonadales bacterium]|nr:DUF2269 domain-containing protein [Pseudomonadales bacterium]